jgi:transposase-like protein
VVSWAEFLDENPGWKEFLPPRDEGIDAVGLMGDGQFMAIQHKCWKSDASLGSRALNTFVGEANVDHPDDPDAKLFAHKLLVMTFDKIDARAFKKLARHNVLIMDRRYLTEHDDAWPNALAEAEQMKGQVLASGLARRYPLLDDVGWLTREANARTAVDIAAELGCSNVTVSAAIIRHGIEIQGPPPPWERYSDLGDADWLRARNDATTTKKIADEVGCYSSDVEWALRHHGIGAPNRPFGWPNMTAEKLQDVDWLIRRYVTEEATVGEIVREVGRSPRVVRQALEYYGIEIVADRPERAPARTGPPSPLLEDVGWLTHRRATGVSIRTIAVELGCDVAQVNEALTRHGISRRPERVYSPPQELSDAGWVTRRFLTENASIEDVAEQLGCTASEAAEAFARHCLPAPPPPGAWATVKHWQLQLADWVVRRYVTEGATTAEIAAELGCNTSSVSQALHRHASAINQALAARAAATPVGAVTEREAVR